MNKRAMYALQSVLTGLAGAQPVTIVATNGRSTESRAGRDSVTTSGKNQQYSTSVRAYQKSVLNIDTLNNQLLR